MRAERARGRLSSPERARPSAFGLPRTAFFVFDWSRSAQPEYPPNGSGVAVDSEPFADRQQTGGPHRPRVVEFRLPLRVRGDRARLNARSEQEPRSGLLETTAPVPGVSCAARARARLLPMDEGSLLIADRPAAGSPRMLARGVFDAQAVGARERPGRSARVEAAPRSAA